MGTVSTSSVVNESGLFDWRVAFNLDILNAEKVNVFAERGVEPNDIALPIPAGSLCFMRRVFQLMAEVAVT